jgi:hypothetical protein
MIGSIFGRQDAVALMRRVATEVRGNPEAEEGLKKAVIDHIANNFFGDKAEGPLTLNTIKGEAFKRFVSKNMGPLAQVFKPQEIAGIRAVADDLARSDQSLHTKLPGQSNTAQDQARETQEHSGLGVLTETIVGGSEAAHHLGVVGAIGGAGEAVGKMLLNVARQAGLRTVDDVVREMLLHPELARAGLQRAANAQQATQNAMTFAQIRRISVFAPALSDAIRADQQRSAK